MLLVTFHGGSSPGINNVYAYETPGGSLANPSALDVPNSVTLSELRAMVPANGYLYVANGAKSTSTVLCCNVPSCGSSFSYVSTVIGPQLSDKGHFETSIAHPFGIAFDGRETCYVSNQDTNVVAEVDLTPKGHSGSLRKGCQAKYLNKLYPKGTFLDGTYVASQVGKLHDVSVEATDVPVNKGGLGVTLDSSGKVQNSVRDVAVANGILLVCNEPDQVVNMYSLADGTFLGPSNKLKDKPTHLAMFNGGLYVSAGSSLYWGKLPASVKKASLKLQAIALAPPQGNKIGGISFDNAGKAATVYIPFQAGTGAADGGSIYTYTVTQTKSSSRPTLSNPAVFVASSALIDTPEFVLYLS